MGQPASRIGVGAQAGVALPERGVPADRFVDDPASVGPRSSGERLAESLSASERARSAAGSAEVGRARAGTPNGGPGAESAQSYRALGDEEGYQEARSQRY